MDFFDVQTVEEGRRDAETFMTDACVISRLTGHTTDSVTAKVVETRRQLYSGSCRVTGSEAQANTPEAVGHQNTVENQMVYLPFNSEAEAGDEVLITESLLDPQLVGLKFKIKAMARGSQLTARRWTVELVTK